MDELDSEHCAFLRLSDAIVCSIFAHFGDVELHAFSQLCHRTHQLALALYFSRHGISDPVENSEVDLRYSKYSEEGQFDVLCALQIALFVPSIRRLSIFFSETKQLKRYIEKWVSDSETSLLDPIREPPTLTLSSLQATMERLCGEIRRCHKLLEKLTSVNEVTITFPGSLRWNLEEVLREHDDDIVECSPIHDFLTLVVEKSCSSLRVRGAYFPRPAPLPTVQKRKPQGKNRGKYSYPGTKHALPPSWQALTRSRLTTFHIDSPILLFSMSVQWTLSVIQWSEITSLRLSYLRLSWGAWVQFTSSVTTAVPELTELALVHCTIFPARIMWLVDHLPNLTSLSIINTDSGEIFLTYPRIITTFSRWIFPTYQNLTTLSAPHSYVSAVLAYSDPPPRLKSLKLLPCHVSHIDKQCKHIFVHMPRIIHHLRERNNTIKPHLVISFGWNERSMFNNIDSSLSMDAEAKYALITITHLILETYDPLVECFGPWTLSVFPRWLAMFPSLQCVSWSGTSPGNDMENFYRLIRAFSLACPHVETVTVNEEQYTSAVILASMARCTDSDQGVGFLDLPTDVLLTIFEFLSSELFNLSLLCRRLHFLALPIFLSQKGIPDPCTTSRVYVGYGTPEVDALSGLTISLFVPSIKLLSCSFCGPSYLYLHLDRIRRLTRLIKRLTSVELVSLTFSRNYYRPQVSSPTARDRLWEQCYSHLADLFRAITEKSCTFLLVKGPPGPVESWSYSPPIPLPCLPSIERLSLMECGLPYAKWIFSALKSCRITRLKIAGPPDSADWPESMNDIVPVDVLDLSLYGYDNASDVLKFLCKRPILTSLKLHGELPRQFPAGFDRPVPNFVHLTTLNAHPSYFSYFLSSNPMPLPHLAFVTIRLNDISEAGWTLSSIVERVRECYPLSPKLSVDLAGVYGTASITESMNDILGLGGKWRHACRHLTGLTMLYTAYWWTWRGYSNIPSLISRWAALFPGIETLSMNGECPYDSDTVCKPPIAFVESITQACPKIKTIEWDLIPVFRRDTPTI